MRAQSEKGDRRRILKLRRHLSYGTAGFLKDYRAKEYQ
jgi:hypothetical protein